MLWIRRTRIQKYCCLLYIKANWLLVPFSKEEKCKVFRLSCSCLASQKRTSQSRGAKDAVYYLSVNNPGKKMKIQLKICLQVILWLWFERVLEDVAAGGNPTSQKTGSSVSDANLMFEFLLGGVELDQDNNIVLFDKEMASMRQGRAFLSQINDNIPRSLSSMTQMVTVLEGQRMRLLTQAQFESLVLSMVYSAYQALHQERKEEQEAWGGMLLQLANVTVHELRGSYLFSYA
ncbi:protein FAM180A [Micropterus salmoides]|uniref:protein FAM180A n=1 Tax=Micropterus salmoides TaxID=27706 RepID=UPI0018EC3632|nr:protein FAM180A [Micropterus salmoides]